LTALRFFRSAAIAAFFVGATVILTWPQATFLRSGIADHFDPLFSTWRLAWPALQFARAPLALFDANIHHPLPNTFAYSDASLFAGTLVVPLLWGGVHPILVYNLVLLGSIAFSGFCAYLLARALTAHTPAALVAGVAYGFWTYRIDHYMHLELQGTFWIPLMLLAIHRTIERPRLKSGVAAGLLLVGQALTTWYYAAYLAPFAAIVAAVLLAPGPERPPAARRAFAALAAGAAVAAVLLALYMMPFAAARTSVGQRDIGDVLHYSAQPQHYLAAHPSNRVFGWTAGFGLSERFLFPGLVALVFALAGAWPPLDRVRIAYVLAGLFAFEASLGVNGFTYPIAWSLMPFWQAFRVTARFDVLVQLSIAVLAAFGVRRVLLHLRTPRLQGCVAAALVALALIEYSSHDMGLVRLPDRVPWLYRWLRQQPPIAILELPLPTMDDLGSSRDSLYMYLSLFHGQQLANGYSAFLPREYEAMVHAMRQFPSRRSIRHLRRRGVDYVIVHKQFFGEREYIELTERIRNERALRLFGTFHDGWGAADVYRWRTPQGSARHGAGEGPGVQ
jgi:hypothetical protein